MSTLALTLAPTCRTVVLLVESHEDTRDMYAECLRDYGFTVTTADSTDDGLRRASNADVIVTEIRVHGSFDGLGLVGRLRHADETKQTPIVVLTACAFESDRQRAQAAGCIRSDGIRTAAIVRRSIQSTRRVRGRRDDDRAAHGGSD